MGIPVSKQSRLSCRRAESSDAAPYLPQFNVAPAERCFKFTSYDRRDVQCGAGGAKVTLENLVLFSYFNSETIPLVHIRRYGAEGPCFFFDTGQRCSSGVVRHLLWMDKAEEMVCELDRMLAWCAQERIRKEKEEAETKCNDLKEPMSSSLMQRRAAAMNAYVIEPVAEQRRHAYRRRERNLITTSSDTDSCSDMDRRRTAAAATTADGSATLPCNQPLAPAAAAGSSSGRRHASPKSGSPASGSPGEVLERRPQGAKAPSPSKSAAHRIRLNGESSGESTSSRHRSRLPPRARSRHAHAYKPATGMPPHFELQFAGGGGGGGDMHSPSLDSLDMLSSSDVGATEDSSTTDLYRSPSTSANDIDSLSGHSLQSGGLRLDLPYGGGGGAAGSALSASPPSAKTIVPSPCGTLTLAAAVALDHDDDDDDDDSATESESDKTLCAGSPSSVESKFSMPVVTSSSSNGGGGGGGGCNSSGADSSGSSAAARSPATARDAGRPSMWHSSAVALSSASTTLRDGVAFEMGEDTDSPPMTGGESPSPPPPAVACRHLATATTTTVATAFSLGSSESLGSTLAAATAAATTLCASCAERARRDVVTSFSTAATATS